jgi:uncharacterized protein YcbX
MTSVAGTVERIWRYPIKSTGGERLPAAAIEARGLRGDRLFAVRDRDGKFGSGKSTRRFRRMPGLMSLGSRYLDDADRVELLDPDGTPTPDPTAYIRHYLRRDDVEIAREGEIPHFDQLPVSLLSTATLDWLRAALPDVAVDERRLRPNLLVRTPPDAPAFVEDGWVGRTVRVGDSVELDIVRGCARCVMTTLPQPGLEHAPRVLRTINAARSGVLAILATVRTTGTVRVCDSVAVL